MQCSHTFSALNTPFPISLPTNSTRLAFSPQRSWIVDVVRSGEPARSIRSQATDAVHEALASKVALKEAREEVMNLKSRLTTLLSKERRERARIEKLEAHTARRDAFKQKAIRSMHSGIASSLMVQLLHCMENPNVNTLLNMRTLLRENPSHGKSALRLMRSMLCAMESSCCGGHSDAMHHAPIDGVVEIESTRVNDGRGGESLQVIHDKWRLLTMHKWVSPPGADEVAIARAARASHRMSIIAAWRKDDEVSALVDASNTAHASEPAAMIRILFRLLLY